MNGLKDNVSLLNADGVDFVPIGTSILFNKNGNELDKKPYKSYNRKQIFNNEYEILDLKEPYEFIYWILINNKKFYISNQETNIVSLVSFSKALQLMKNGKKLSRLGWNGQNQFIYYVPKGSYIPCTEIAEQLVNEDGLVDYKPYIALKTVQNDVVPWTPSITDVLSEDWMVI